MVDPGESVSATVKREFEEEAGNVRTLPPAAAGPVRSPSEGDALAPQTTPRS